MSAWATLTIVTRSCTFWPNTKSVGPVVVVGIVAFAVLNRFAVLARPLVDDDAAAAAAVASVPFVADEPTTPEADDAVAVAMSLLLLSAPSASAIRNGLVAVDAGVPADDGAGDA